MRTLKIIFGALLKIILVVLGIGATGIAAFAWAFIGTIIGLLLISLVVNWVYSLLIVDIAALPIITYWVWFKIIVVVRLVFGTFRISADNSDKQKQQTSPVKSQRTKTLENK